MNSKEALQLSGRNLQSIRNTKGFSIQALAVLSQVDEEIITAMENGDFDFPVNVVFELAATLNVDIREILVDMTAS
jgi:predicted transcriptional regulator